MAIENRPESPHSREGIQQNSTTVPHEWLDPYHKPIITVRARHGNNDTDGIVLMDRAVRGQLKATQFSHPDKKVAVVLEHASGTREFSEGVRSRIADKDAPLLPSDAFTAQVATELFPEGIPVGINNEFVKDAIMSPNTKKQFAVLDQVARDYPGKLEVLFESHEPDVIDTVTDPVQEVAFAGLSSFIVSGVEDLLDEDYDLFRNAVGEVAHTTALRDIDNAITIVKLIEEPHVFAVVHTEGAVHRTGDILSTKGLHVEQQHADGPYGMLSTNELVRQKMAHPEIVLSDENIRDAITADRQKIKIEPKDSVDVKMAKLNAWTTGSYFHQIDTV